MSALVAIWPTSGRIEAWGAFPGNPDLLDRGQADGVGDLYSRMEKQGELWTYPGRVVDVGQFLKDSAARFSSKVARSAADRYRKAEALDALDSPALRWPFELRGMGASSIADGSADVRAFQNLVLTGAIKHDGISSARKRDYGGRNSERPGGKSSAFKVAEQWAHRRFKRCGPGGWAVQAARSIQAPEKN